MRKKRRIVKSGLMCLALTAVLGGAAAGLMQSHMEPRIEYRAEAQSGDTVWSICRRIATDKDPLPELVWKTMEENHITDPTALRPGQVVVVHVKEHHPEARQEDK